MPKKTKVRNWYYVIIRHVLAEVCKMHCIQIDLVIYVFINEYIYTFLLNAIICIHFTFGEMDGPWYKILIITKTWVIAGLCRTMLIKWWYLTLQTYERDTNKIVFGLTRYKHALLHFWRECKKIIRRQYLVLSLSSSALSLLFSHTLKLGNLQ